MTDGRRVIRHIGTGHVGDEPHSGRYKWGSGENPNQRDHSFSAQVRRLRKEGYSDLEIAKGYGISTTTLRARISIEKDAAKAAKAAEAWRFKEEGLSNTEIGKRMGINESTVRSILEPGYRARLGILESTANMLRETVKDKTYVDIGSGIETQLGVGRTKFNTAVAMLKDEGYVIDTLDQKQVGTGKYTRLKVLAPPGTTRHDLLLALRDNKIEMIKNFSKDGGETWEGALRPVERVGRNRIFVKYGDEGGTDKDGVIELRRNVPDLDLGNSHYSQVRIGVDGDLYMKGMALYSDNVPAGYDVIYNTNKKRGTPDNKVFKPMERDKNGVIDETNPFGSAIKPGGQHGALNVVNDEGDWGEWARTISSQVLSKQRPDLARRQLKEALDIRTEEFEEIMTLTNPAIKKRLLDAFAENADSAAVHLKAAAIPRQASQVILPFSSIKPNEIYAPGYREGEIVALVRHPHGGTFEIPELVVNNKNQEARRIIGNNPKDAVGIHPSVASRLSGADFDGDSVLVIPNDNHAIKTSDPLKELENFDPKTAYPEYPGMVVMKEKTKQLKMGDISNLITDMTIKGASPDKIARAVKHSMVVIDAVKHKLDYKTSYVENGIAQLKREYQGSEKKGASTIISRSKSEKRLPHRTRDERVSTPYEEYIDEETGKLKSRGNTDPVTGEKRYKYTGETYLKRRSYKDPETGKRVFIDPPGQGIPTGRMIKSTKMAEATDAYELVDKPGVLVMESIYADHANALKKLANTARLRSLEIKHTEASPSAKKVYSREVDSLKAKLENAARNKPLERLAQRIANQQISARRHAMPDNLDEEEMKDQLKKIKSRALIEARHRTGADKHDIEITPKEWEAIQAGAISHNLLTQIILNTDLDKLKVLAMPRSMHGMSPARIARARSMNKAGSTPAEIAQALGVSVDTVNEALG